MRASQNRFGAARTSLLGCAILAAACLAGTAEAETLALQSSYSLTRNVAAELLAGVKNASIEDIPANGGYSKPRIAVLPIETRNGPVESWVLNELNSRLLAELMRQGNRQFSFIDAETEAGDQAVRRIDGLPESGDLRMAWVGVPVDIVIKGTLHRTGRRGTVSYLAISAGSGLVLAASTPQYVALESAPSAVAQLPPPPIPQPAPILAPAIPPSYPMAGQGRSTVAEAQRLLGSLGYRPGPSDGIMRQETRAAIRAFEQDRELPAQGRLSRGLMTRLRAEAQQPGPPVLNTTSDVAEALTL